MSKDKDYYKITEVTAQFEETVYGWAQRGEVLPIQTEIQLWQARFMCAIAQQLSIVAGHLGKIVRKAETTDGQN